MDSLNTKLREILQKKSLEIEEILSNSSKGKVATSGTKDEMDYTSKSTLSKIQAEQDRKLKSSKAYKNKNQYDS